MTPHDPLYFLYLGLVFGIGFTGMLVGLIIIWSNRSNKTEKDKEARDRLEYERLKEKFGDS